MQNQKSAQKELKSQKDSKDDTIFNLKDQLLDIEEVIANLKTLNSLLTCFANENCPESALIAELISKELENAQEIIRRK